MRFFWLTYFCHCCSNVLRKSSSIMRAKTVKSSVNTFKGLLLILDYSALDRLATFHSLLLFCSFRSELDNRDSFNGLSSSVSYGEHHLILPSEKTEAWVQSRGETRTADNWRCCSEVVRKAANWARCRQNLVIMQKISGCNRSLRWCFEVKVKTQRRTLRLLPWTDFVKMRRALQNLVRQVTSWFISWEIGNTAHIVCSFVRLICIFVTFVRYRLVFPKGK